MNNTELAYWLRKNIWDVRAAAALLLGFIPIQEGNGAITVNLPPHRPNDPLSRDWQAELQAICRQANEDIDAGVLPHLDKRKERRVSPIAFARWAIAQGYEVPDPWQTTLLSAQDMHRPIDNPPPEHQPSVTEMEQKPSKEKRRVGWLRELLSAWPDIVKSHGANPGALKAMSWLKKNGPSDMFPRDQADIYSLQWIDETGNLHAVPQKTVQNRISECRNTGEIPG